MARLGRRFPFQPSLQGPVVINPMTLPLEDQRTIDTVTPLPDQRERRRQPHSVLGKPTVVGAAVVALSLDQQRIRRVLAQSRRGKSTSKLFPPATLRAVTRDQLTLRVVLAEPPRRPAVRSKLGPPILAQVAGVVEDKIRRVLSRSPRAQHLASRLFPPATLQQAQAQPPVETTVRIISAVLDRLQRRDSQQPVLGAPITVDPAAPNPPVQSDIRIVFPVRTQRQRHKTTYEIKDPVVIGEGPPVVIGIYTTLAAIQTRVQHVKRAKPRSRLYPPSVLQAVVAPVVTTLRLVIPQRRQDVRYRSKWKLSAPTVVLVVQPVVKLMTALARTPIRPFRSKLRPPAVAAPVAQPPVVTEIITNLVSQRTRMQVERRTRSRLFPPVVVDAAQAVVRLLRTIMGVGQ